MRIALATLNSKFIHSSLSLWCIKAGVDGFCTEKHEVKVFESTVNADTDKFCDEIISFKPDIVAFSCYIWNIEKTLPLCERIKEGTDCIIALGGPEVEYCAEDILRKISFVDYIISGEGEWSFSSFVNGLEIKNFEEAEGVSFIDNGKYIYFAAKAHKDTPPSPYCDEYFKTLNGRIAYIESGRGCPFRCAYCLSGQLPGLRYFDEITVFDNIVKLSHSGAKTIKFIDRTFNADAKRADRILSFIKDNYGKAINENVCFHFEIAADILKDSTIEILSAMPSGLCQLEIGIQSFNEKTLKAINRKSDLDKLCKNIKRLISFRNMHIHTDLIAGLPFEDAESFKNSFNKAFELKSDMLQLGFLKMLYGAEMRRNEDAFPCEYESTPPYEILSNEWLSESDIKTLKHCESALDRLYNSGRFLITLNFLFDSLKFDPFDTFCEFGGSCDFSCMGLSEFTEKVWLFFNDRCDENKLRECILADINSLPVNIHMPDCIVKYDPMYKRLKKKYAELLRKNVRIVLLHSENKVMVILSDKTDKITGRYEFELFDYEE